MTLVHQKLPDFDDPELQGALSELDDSLDQLEQVLDHLEYEMIKKSPGENQ